MIELKRHLVGELALGKSEGSLQILSQSLPLLVSLDCSQNLERWDVIKLMTFPLGKPSKKNHGGVWGCKSGHIC